MQFEVKIFTDDFTQNLFRMRERNIKNTISKFNVIDACFFNKNFNFIGYTPWIY